MTIALTLSSDINLCEHSMLVTIATLLSHDYHVTVQRAKAGYNHNYYSSYHTMSCIGIEKVFGSAKFMSEKLLLILRHVGRESHDIGACHVIVM